MIYYFKGLLWSEYGMFVNGLWKTLYSTDNGGSRMDRSDYKEGELSNTTSISENKLIKILFGESND